jgi:hypothetical protein
MASATSSRAVEATPVAVLAGRLAARAIDGVPLLVFRVPALERTAWRDGLRAARAIERRVTAAFATAVARVLRAEDQTAHDRGTDTFVAALVAPMRDGQRTVTPVDIRSALARIAATVEGLTQLDVDAGWTRYDRAGGIAAAIDVALARGARERERYAFFSRSAGISKRCSAMTSTSRRAPVSCASRTANRCA